MSVGWYLLPNISFFFSPAKWLHSTKMWQTVRIHWQFSHTEWRIFPQDVWMDQMCMPDAGTTQDNRILPALPVGGLPIFQDRLVRDRTIPITLPSGKNIRANMLYKISIGYTNLDKRQIQGRLGSSRPIARFRRGGPLAAFGSVAVEAHSTLEYHKVKGDKTYNMEAPWMRRPMANCPAYPVPNPALFIAPNANMSRVPSKT